MEANTAMQVNAVIDHIADKLAVPSAKLMELLPALGMRDVVIGGVFLVGWLVCAALLIAGWRATRRRDDKDSLFFIALFGGGPMLIILPLVVIKIADLALWLYSPEAWAVRYVFNHLFAGE